VPTAFTEASELMTAFGLLGRDPLETGFDEIAPIFDGTLTREKLERFAAELRQSARRKGDYARLWRVGRALAMACAGGGAVERLQWQGPFRQGRSVSAAKDLCVNGGTFVSIKTNSKIVFNLSPYNLFCAIPRGESLAAREVNWFLHSAPEEYEALYGFVRRCAPCGGLPARAEEFERSAGRGVRDAVQEGLKALPREQAGEFDRLYRALCHRVSAHSARLFNENLASVRRTQRRAVEEHILRHFLRLDSIPYYLAGIDGGKVFIVRVPDITEWLRCRSLSEVQARPDATRGQSIVHFSLAVAERAGGGSLTYPFHAEVRWSHGKFCGSPEGKLYKSFPWADVASFTSYPVA